MSRPSSPPFLSANPTLDQVQQTAWQSFSAANKRKSALVTESEQLTNRRALQNLLVQIQHSLAALSQNQPVTAQTHLENAFLQMMITLSQFGIEASPAFQRALYRLQHQNLMPVMVIDPDQARLMIGNEVQGTYPIDSEEAYQTCLSLAHSLGCPVIYDEHQQLALFGQQPESSTHVS